MRIVICGWPGSGKSFLAKELGSKLGITPKSTDSLVRTHDWSAASALVSTWFDIEEPWIIEGMTVPRALRKWHVRNPGGDPPFDKIYVMPHPDEKQRLKMTQGQITMGRGHDTVLRELEDWLGPLL
jgi:hypothetical protein